MMGASVTGQFITKKELKGAVGERPDFEETSMFGPEFHGDGRYTVVVPHPLDRRWFATVTVEDGLIARVT